MTVSVETITDKIDTILEAEGFVEQPTVTELTGNPTWAKWDDEKKVETIVSLHTDPAFVIVEFEDEDHKRLSSSGKFYVGAENVWVYFENTLKLAIKGF